MDEFERIDEIRKRLAAACPLAPGVTLGIGDDAAILAPSTRAQVLSVDSAIEGVHFRLDFGAPERLGRHAVMAAASDLAAMGARPRCALSSLVLPDSLDDELLLRLTDGFAQAAKELGMPIVGGNLASGRALGITTTVVGELDAAALTRAGARPGDVVYVSGELGGCGLGLHILLHPELGATPGAQRFVDAWLDATAAIDTGLSLVGHASACVDVSDGFAQDLGHVLTASHVGARIELSKLPRAEGFEARATEFGAHAYDLMLAGGEDYVLLFTAPPDDAVAAELGTSVGVITREPGLVLIAPDGEQRPPPAGFRHGGR